MKEFFRVALQTTDEHGMKHAAYELFFTSRRKANAYINQEVECMRGVASEITDKRPCIVYERSVKVFIGKEGYHSHYTLQKLVAE